MKKGLLILSLLAVFITIKAQEAKIEKLQQQIKQHIQQDTFRVNRLNELGKSAVLSPEKSDSLINEALFISRKINYAPGECHALINLAEVRSQRGEKLQSLTLLEQANAIAEKMDDQELLVEVLSGMGKTKNQTVENKQALAYYLKAEGIAQKLENKVPLASCQRNIGSLYQNSLSDYPKSMEWFLKSMKTAEEANCLSCLAEAWTGIAALYTTMGDHEKSLVYYKKAFDANKQLGNKMIQFRLLNNIGERYRLLGNYPEAIKAYTGALEGSNTPYFIELNESNLADVYVRLNNLPAAFTYAFKSLSTAKKIGDVEGVAWIDGILARAYLQQGKTDSALYYAKHGLDAANETGTLEFMRDNSGALANAYLQKKDFANAYTFQNLYITYRDSMVNAQVTNQSNLMQYNYDLEKKQAQIIALNQDKKLQYYFLISTLIVLGLIAVTVIVLLRNNRQKQKANNLLSSQKHLIEDQRDRTDKALAELKLTQKQLIQSEKMAGLGELTAGVAHEIQNPLNFVNNFSEVNRELLGEMKEEITKGNLDEVISIADSVIINEEKINYHGKRADSIVKGMLQHSRHSSATKEPADINALCEEYIRLCYHGIRAKDKDFNAAINTDFDKSIGKINIIPQDVGRVLLNLLTNAFYAVKERQKAEGEMYKPSVSVQTNKTDGHIEISVNDNGDGISQNVVDKIFQPFFTTKPTGEGTGLGLSLSYDIIKAHGGEIKVETKEGEGTTFIIQLLA